MSERRTKEDVDAAALWLDVSQAIASRAAHEVRNALNGVAVNLEVVRSRSEREGMAMDAVARFASAAGTQFEELSRLTEALLALARPMRTPVSVTEAAAQIVTLLSASAGGAGGGVRLEHGGDMPETTADGDAVRAILASALLLALEESPRVLCSMGADGGGTVGISGERAPHDGLARLSKRAAAVAKRAGIRIATTPHGFTLSFPA